MTHTLGTCSLCGGAVTVPAVWHGVIPPVPKCSRCGARAKPTGPVIEMERPRGTTRSVVYSDGVSVVIDETWGWK